MIRVEMGRRNAVRSEVRSAMIPKSQGKVAPPIDPHIKSHPGILIPSRWAYVVALETWRL